MNLQLELLQTGREILASGLVAGTWGNLSVWEPERQAFWITPSGMDYRNLQEDDLVLLDLQGKVVQGQRRHSSESWLHRQIYAHRPDVKGIIHTHSAYATAHAVACISIPPIVEDLVQIAGGAVECAVYAEPGSQALAKAALKALGNRSAVLLANHGLVGVGPVLAEALKVCQVVEKAAQIHVAARLLGQPVVLGENDVVRMRDSYLHSYGQR